MLHTARLVQILSLEEARHEIERLGADPAGVKIMAPKAVHRPIKLRNVPIPAAQILKEEMLSAGGEAARTKGAVNYSVPETDVLLLGTVRQYRRLINKLRAQPFKLRALAAELSDLLRTLESRPACEPLSRLGLPFGERTLVMGILNLTPDSFSGDGLGKDRAAAVEQAGRMLQAGADILDLGGESTRPGAGEVALEEELDRVVPAIRAIKSAFPDAPLSVDTSKSAVARTAVEAGADIINDISGLRFDPRMAEVAAESGCPLILMHIKGTPRDMQQDPAYESLIDEILDSWRQSMRLARESGAEDDQVLLDPGIGFGKTMEHNLEILRRLSELRSLGRPLVVGTSRKSFIGRILDLPVEERLEGTAATVALGIAGGADIVRVHDVREMARVARVADAIQQGGSDGV